MHFALFVFLSVVLNLPPLISKVSCIETFGSNSTHPLGGDFKDSIEYAFNALQSQMIEQSDSGHDYYYELLGTGSSGSVRLFDVPHGNGSKLEVAVKSFWSTVSRADIRHEFVIAKALDHPNIVRTFELRKTHHDDYVLHHQFMEYVPYDLPAFLSTFHPLRQEIFDIFRQICAGVAYLHARGLAHLDLKPENVLISRDGTPKITDFGSSEAVSKVLSLSHASCVALGHNTLIHGIRGSEPYMPPEMYGEAKYDGQKADIWALGILFVQMALEDFTMPWNSSTTGDAAFATFVTADHEQMEISENKDGKGSRSRQDNEPSSSIYLTREELLLSLPRGSRKLVRNMLDLNPQKRPMIDEILGDPWMEAVP